MIIKDYFSKLQEAFHLLADTSYIKEAALAMNQSHDARRGHVRDALMKAHGVTDRWSQNSPWITDMFDGHVVYQQGDQTLKRNYTIDHGAAGSVPKVTLGDHKPVHRAYMDSKTQESSAVLWSESVIITQEGEAITESIDSDCFDLTAVETITEGAAQTVRSAGNIPVKLIGPGWGSSGYYSAEMLKRDGPKVFTPNMHMYMNHATEAERKARPEGDVRNLVGVLAGKTVWMESGFKGPGLYNEMKPFSDHEKVIREKGKYIGSSINAFGKKVDGEAEGRKGKIVECLYAAASVDVVTRPGAKGALLTESDRPAEAAPNEEKETMTTEEQAQLTEARTLLAAEQAKNARLVLESNQAIATATFIQAFAKKGVTLTVESAKVFAANPPLKDGVVDAAVINAAVEALNIASPKAAPKGKVLNLGKGAEVAEESEDAANLKALGHELKGMGLTEAMLQVSAPYTLGGAK